MNFFDLAAMPVTKIRGLAEENEVTHHTEKYESQGLFLRRGQTFKIEIDLSREFRENEDEFEIRLETGRNPRKRNNTLAIAEKVNEFDKVRSA